MWYDLGTLYESCNNQVQDALDAYQRAADLDPTNPHIKQRLELLRKSQGGGGGSSGASAAPVPQDVNNPNQYQNGQALNGNAFSQSQGPQGPPAGMAQYPSIANQPRGGDSRSGPPMHDFPPHESAGGPPRDLPMPGGPGGGRRSSPGPYGQHHEVKTTDDVRIADIGGGRAPTPSERTQMNPIHDGPGRASGGMPHSHGPPPSQPSPLPKRQQQPSHPKSGRDDMRSPIPLHQVAGETSRMTPPGTMARPPSRGPSPHTSHYSSPRQHHATTAANDQHYMHHDQMPSNNNARRSSDPYEHEGIFHRVQQKSTHPASGPPSSAPYAQSENNGFHPTEQRGSPAVKQEDESRAGGHYREPENHVDAASERKQQPAEERPVNREVDEDYDETAADTLMSIAQTGGRKRSLDRNDEAANIDSDSKRPKPAAEEPIAAAAATTEEPSQQPPVEAAAPAPAPPPAQENATAEAEKLSSPVVAEQQPVEPSPAAEQEEPKDDTMEDAPPVSDENTTDTTPAVAAAAAAEEEKEEQPKSPVNEAAEEAEAEAEPEKEDGETDAVEPSKEDQEAAEASEPEAGEVTPSPEATTA